MPQVIHKFPLTVSIYPQIVTELAGREHEVVHVGWDERNACPAVWVRYDPAPALMPSILPPELRVMATGEEFAPDARHLGTVHHGGFVWHVLRLR